MASHHCPIGGSAHEPIGYRSPKTRRFRNAAACPPGRDSRVGASPARKQSTLPRNCFTPANLLVRSSERKRPKIKLIGRFQSVYWSNLCTRHIPEKLTPRGHHEWL